MKKTLILFVGILLFSMQLIAADLPKKVLESVLKHGTKEEIVYEEQYEEDGKTIYEVTLQKKGYQVTLILDMNGKVLESIKSDDEEEEIEADEPLDE
jgi:uncharacterized membrane protein YkoI